MHVTQTSLAREAHLTAFHGLIGAIYEAVGRNHRWTDVLHELNSYTGSKTAVLEISPGYTTGKPHFYAVGELSGPEAIAEWENRRPLEMIAYPLSPGQVQVCNDYAALGVAPEFAALLRKYAVSRSISCCLEINEGRQLYFHAARSDQAPPYTQDEADLLHLVAEHLRRAMNQHLRLSRFSRLATFGPDVISEFGIGILLVERTGDVHLINSEAERVITRNEPLSLRPHGLVLDVARENRQLAMLVRRALDPDQPGLEEGAETVLHVGAMRATSTRSDAACNIAVKSAPIGAYPFGTTERCALIYVDDGSRELHSVQALRSMFNLTAAEARVASLVIEGHDFPQIPGLLKIQPSTLRFHVNAIYEKLGARNKGQMIAILMASRPFLGRAPADERLANSPALT